MKYTMRKLFKTTTASDKLNRTCSLSTISTQSTEDRRNNAADEIRHLMHRIHDLESEIKTNREETQLREEKLQNLVLIGQHNCQKLRAELDMTKHEQSSAERELIHIKLHQRMGQISAESSSQRVKESAHTLCRAVSTDRIWIEAEMARRALNVDKMTEKNAVELARMKRRFATNY